MSESARLDDPLLLQAAVDGELDAASMIEAEARITANPTLAAEYARLCALRDAIRARLQRDVIPESLRARIIALTETNVAAPATEPLNARVKSITQRAHWGRIHWILLDAPYRSLAASLMLGLAVGAGATGLLRSPIANNDDVEQALVSGYVRGRFSGQPVDVATSDRHTVKPWFAGKIASPTTVLDLAKEGFPLVGGRIDVVGGKPVPTLVYQRREHQIALTEMPGAVDVSRPPRRETRDGYSLLLWANNGVRYTAVSDLPPADLDAFWEAFRNAADAEREDIPKL